MNILITGAYGFVGSNLANYLKNNYVLWALDIKEFIPGLYNRFFSWDKYNEIPFNEVDIIIHLAGKAHDTKGKSEADEYFQINTELTKKVFDSFLSSKARIFLFFSSVKAAADIAGLDPLKEDVIPSPNGAYGESKIKAEEYLLNQSWGEKKLYIFRPCMIHGPGNKGNLNLLYGVINKGIPYPLGNFDNKRSFTSIDNLSFIIQQAIEKNIDSGIYHIADDTPLSTSQLISIICRVMQKRKKIWFLPKSLVKFIARCGDLVHLPLNTFRLNKLIENYVVSNSKIKEAIQIEKLPVSSEEGLIKTIISFKQNN